MTPTVPEYGCSRFDPNRWKINDATDNYRQQYTYRLMLDLPPDMQERVACSIIAAVKYEIPANILLAIAEKENGKPGQWVQNNNGTHDVGSMQLNTAFLQDLSKYGITSDHVAQAGCYAYDLAAWRIRLHIKNDKGDIWTKAANYHSRTPEYNTRYRTDLITKAVKWADWLGERYGRAGKD